MLLLTVSACFLGFFLRSSSFFCYFTGVNIWLYCYSQVHNTPVYFLCERTIDPIFLLPYPNTKSKSTLVKKFLLHMQNHTLPIGSGYGGKNRRKEGGKNRSKNPADNGIPRLSAPQPRLRRILCLLCSQGYAIGTQRRAFQHQNPRICAHPSN